MPPKRVKAIDSKFDTSGSTANFTSNLPQGGLMGSLPLSPWPENPKLANWVRTQRGFVNKGKMPEHRRRRLEEIGLRPKETRPVAAVLAVCRRHPVP